MSVVVIDTNVVLVANRRHEAVSEVCVAACAKYLQAVMKTGKIALDDRFLILKEYQNKTTPKTGNGPGDAFVKWALRNNSNPERIDAIAIEDHETRGFKSFPDDPELTMFDLADRKFVAVANAHPARPTILQAADSKWLDWAQPLKKHGLSLEFICEDDIARFHANKFGI